MLRSIFFASCFSALVSMPFAACGGSTSSGGSTGGGSVTGSVGGISLNVADAIASNANGTLGVDAKSVVVEIFDIPSVCALAQTFPAGADKANYTGLVIFFTELNGSPLGPGTYNVGTTIVGPDAGLGARAGASLVKNDAQCQSQVPAGTGAATSGSATITNVTASLVTGTFNLTFPQGSFQGSFNASVCTVPDAGTRVQTDGGRACVQ
jgi:hypothetical protein